MIRVDVHYGGVIYTIPNTDRQAVRARIDAALHDGVPLWLDVNYGAGSVLRTDLLITPGVPVGLAEITDPAED